MLHPFIRTVIAPVYRLWIRKVEGTENIPRDRPFIIALNHSSYYETLLAHSIIIPMLEKRIHPFINSIYFKFPLVNMIINTSRSIPVYLKKDKESRKKNEKSIQIAVNYLKKGELILIFPEGRRSFDGKLGKAYNGIGKMVMKSKMPVLPIGAIGTSKILPKGTMFPRLVRCDAKIGKLMYFNRYFDKPNSKKTHEQITRKIMQEIAKLIGQKYEY